MSNNPDRYHYGDPVQPQEGASGRLASREEVEDGHLADTGYEPVQLTAEVRAQLAALSPEEVAA